MARIKTEGSGARVTVPTFSKAKKLPTPSIKPPRGMATARVREFTDPHGETAIYCICTKPQARRLCDTYGWSEIAPIAHESIAVAGVP